MQLEFNFPVAVSRRCSKCRTVKPGEAFYRAKRNPGGLANWCKACHSAHQSAKYRENPAKFRARHEAWRSRNVEYDMERQRRYVREHREERRAYSKRYMASRPAEVKKAQWAASRLRRLERERKAQNMPSAQDLAALFERGCAYCGATATQIDHVHPLVLGGSNELENLVAACRSCNASKNGRSLLDWHRADRAQHGLMHSAKVQIVFLKQLVNDLGGVWHESV